MQTNSDRTKFQKALAALHFSHNHPQFLAWVKVNTPPRWMPKWVSERLTQYKYAGKTGQVIHIEIGNISGITMFTVHFHTQEPSIWVYTEKDLDFCAEILTPHEKEMLGI